MKKDVIYIDIEDDITAIIGRVRDAKAPIVALVPPKRIGVLQSTVNLKLLQRAADSVKRRIVLITNDQALTALAAGLSIPIARNLQSKPEVAEIPALDTDDDGIINGEELPVGELASTVEPIASQAVQPVMAAPRTKITQPKNVSNSPTKPKPAGKGIKIPNFDTFRKKLFLFGGLGVVVVGFLVWAIFFAGQATVAITARTNIVNISKSLQLRDGATLDANQGVLPLIVHETKKSVSVDFEATGEKNVGERASGTVKFSTSQPSSTTIPAGTELTVSGLKFNLSAAVTVPAATLSFTCGGICPGTANGTIIAPEGGAKYNGASGSVQGAPSGVTASMVNSTSGGTDRMAKVISSEDINNAKEKLQPIDANTVKAELKKEFNSSQIVIDEGFIVTAADPVSTPALDAEATTAKLTQETTYTLVGVERQDLKAIYDAYLEAQLKGDSSQKVYESGDNATQFAQFLKIEEGYSVRATAVAQVGPNIDEKNLAEQLRQKRVGEVQQLVGGIQGVKDVDVQLSPFWVNRVPDSTERIKITFTMTND